MIFDMILGSPSNQLRDLRKWDLNSSINELKNRRFLDEIRDRDGASASQIIDEFNALGNRERV